MSCRQAGKKSNHSFNYGLSPQGFAIQYDLELKYAKQCYQLYHNAYPGLTLWHQHIRNKLSKDRTLENLFGRKRRFLNRWNDDLFKAAYSYIPQSTVGQLLNHGIIETYYAQDLAEFGFLKDWDLLNQVHDSMVFQYRVFDILEDGTKVINKDQVEKLAKTIEFVQRSLDVKLYANGREFIIKTDCKIGLNCKKLMGIDIYNAQPDMINELMQTIEDKLLQRPISEKLIDIDEEEEDEESIEESEE
jgi:DNA polymerase I-like protein with 3'-5' exonuclease and polymerase domains